MAFPGTIALGSTLGVDLNASDSSALFARGTQVLTTNGTRFEYVEASGTFTTGYLVNVTPGGTAYGYTTAMMTAGIAGVAGNDIGFVQGLINRSEFGWVAKQGRDIYVLCTGTCTAGSTVGVAVASTGRLRSQPQGEVGSTIFGIALTTSASLDVASVAIATVTWPRSVSTLTV